MAGARAWRLSRHCLTCIQMDFEIRYITPDIKLSEFKGTMYKAETAFEHHILVWYLSGTSRIIQGDTSYTFGTGSIFLVPRNHVATFINYGDEERPHRAVVMHLETERLKHFYAAQPSTVPTLPPAGIINFDRHPLLESCMASLMPYFDIPDPFPVAIAALKIREAVSILRTIRPDIDPVLSDFAAPGKIDLACYMEQHYRYNLPLERFSYLTGRSLSTFNRDFRKLFHTTPQRWLMQKRLSLAHYQLQEKKMRPVDVYLEVGFEDLSHFSFAFRKQFGYAPSELQAQSASGQSGSHQKGARIGPVDQK